MQFLQTLKGKIIYCSRKNNTVQADGVKGSLFA